MNNIQQIVRIFNPVVKGIPLIIGIMAVMIFLATRIVRYSTPMYECTGRIKLDDPNTDISNTNLFKNFDVFNTPSKIMAEVEVIKSPEMLRLALEHISFDVSLFQKGAIRTSELFYDSPFTITYTIEDENYYGIHFNIKVVDSSHFILDYEKDDTVRRFSGLFDKPALLPGILLNISLNRRVLKNKPGISLSSRYYFTINSKDQQIEELSKYIDVKELDKDIPIVRIICKYPVPEKAMLLTNTLMETYINEGIKLKTSAAKKTVEFIDRQLLEITHNLSISEGEMETYRLKNKITNTKLEVETDLKKVAQLQIQLINVEMNLATLDTLDAYINQGHEDFLLKAPNYEGYGGLLYTELMKRLKDLQSEKKELLLKYTPQSEKITLVDSKIADVVDYIEQNIHNAKNAMRIQRDRIASDIQISELPFKNIPTKEKEMVILERQFQLNQQIYNFLNEKRAEASIAQAATFSFHRIIQRGILPTKPVSPKKTFTLLVFGFLGLLLSLALIYGYHAISSLVMYKDQLEKNSTCPIIADIRHERQSGQAMPDFYALATRLTSGKKRSQLITITSCIDKEGKTFIAQKLAKAFADMKIPVLLVGANLRNKTVSSTYSLQGIKGFSEFITTDAKMEDCIRKTKINGLDVMPEGESAFIPEAIFASSALEEKIKELKKLYKIVIMDTPSFDTALDALSPMRLSDMILYIFRANYTKTRMMIEPDLLKEEYGLDTIRLVLNDVESFAKMKKDRGIRKTVGIFVRKVTLLVKKHTATYKRNHA